MMKSSLSLMVALTLILSSAGLGSSRFACLAEQTRVWRPDASIQDERGLVALDQTLREITNPFTVVCLAARPGDEDDGTLAYVRKKLGARAVILFATRGEAEESPTRGELDRGLSVIRTREAIEAARVIGADVLFLNLRDIGYSKSADEALSEWGHEEALGRMVRAIRSLRPDVIITSHDPTVGEGVQQSVARLALEAFAAAGDTKLAPEAGSEAWPVRRILQRTDQATADVAINLNEYDRVRGLTYAQIGLAAHHRFFSRGSILDRLTLERETSYYKLIAPVSDESFKPGAGLLDGLTLSEKVSQSIAPPRVGDQRLIDAMAAGERLVDALHEKLIEKRAEGTPETMHERYGAEFVRVIRFTSAIERAIVLALGLNLEVSVSDRVLIPGQKLSVRAVLRNGGGRAFPLVFSAPERLPMAEKNSAYKDAEAVGIGPGGIAKNEFEYEIAKDSALTLPHSAHLYDEDYYAVGSSLPGAQPAEPFGNHVVVSAELGLGQVSIRLSALARFDVAPPIEISTIPFVLIKDWSKPRDIEFPVRLRNRNPGPFSGALWVVPLALAEDDYEPVHVSFTREDDELTIKLKLRLPILKPPLSPDVMIEFRREKPAAADPLGSAKISVKPVEFEVSDGVSVGYIPAMDDWLSFALRQLGVAPGELKIDEISTTEHGSQTSAQSRAGCSDLARFDTLIIDRDAFFARPDLLRNNRCLLRYVRQGGSLIVLGQRPDDWNLILSNVQFAPHPLRLSKNRIALETAPVKILDTDHPLMSKPNKITSKDFEGWLVERAINVPQEWSSEYTPLLESSDPGEEPNRGGLLIARYGEGTYVYTTFAWRRQLITGNIGAYRLLSNLVSLPKVTKPAKPQ